MKRSTLILSSIAALAVLALAVCTLQYLMEWPLTTNAQIKASKMQPRASTEHHASVRIPLEEGMTGLLLENGKSIGTQAPLVEEIKALGKGRYKAKQGVLYFSSSDGTNPRSNGRTYTFKYPLKVHPWIMIGLSILVPLLIGIAAVCDRSQFEAWGRQVVLFFSDAEDSINMSWNDETRSLT